MNLYSENPSMKMNKGNYPTKVEKVGRRQRGWFCVSEAYGLFLKTSITLNKPL